MKKKTIIYMLLLSGLLHTAPVAGAPAYPGLINLIQPDGSILKGYLLGDEHAHLYITADSIPLKVNDKGYYCYAVKNAQNRVVAGNLVAHDKTLRKSEEIKIAEKAKREIGLNMLLQQARPIKAPVQKMMGNPDVPSTGTFHGLVILANYPNMKFADNNTPEKIERMLNQPGYNDDGANGSVADYFKDMSGGRFNPQFDVVGPVMLSHDYGYYGSDSPSQDANAALMIKEACQLADAQGADFSKYDNNGDGQADMVYVIYAGYSQSNGAPTNTVWPHMYYLKMSGNDTMIDNTIINCYATGGERIGTSGTTMMGIGLICHEFSHTLGLPDIYDTSVSYPKNLTLGQWDVMDRGCYNNNARTPSSYTSYEKSKLQWLTPTIFDQEQKQVQLKSLAHNEAIKMVNPNNEKEYFLLENRSKADKWDAFIPGEGLLVLHVNYDSLLFDQNQVNVEAKSYRMHIISASGNNLTSNDAAAVTYPGTTGNHTFTPFSSPATLFADGTTLNVPVTNIEYDGNIVTFDYGQLPVTPELTAETEVTDSSFRANWNRVDGAKYYEVEITNTETGNVDSYDKIVRNRFTLSNLSSKVSYSYRVRCRDLYAYSEWTQPRTINLSQLSIVSAGSTPDNVPAQYFDLMGRKVATPSHGIFIKVQGNKKSKITVK